MHGLIALETWRHRRHWCMKGRELVVSIAILGSKEESFLHARGAGYFFRPMRAHQYCSEGVLFGGTDGTWVYVDRLHTFRNRS